VNRLYGSDKDVAEIDDFDFSMTGPRLLGRDIAVIASEDTLSSIINILEKEARDDSLLRLSQDMVFGVYIDNAHLESGVKILRLLRQGIIDIPKKGTE